MAIMAYDVANYISKTKASAGKSDFAFMGAGFLSLDENPNAKVNTVAYMNDKSMSSGIDGYEFKFPFTSHLLLESGAEEEAIQSVYEVPYHLQTGTDAEREFIRVDLYAPISAKESTFQARKFKVSVSISSITGKATEKMEMSGELGGVGDPIHGEFDTKTRTFTGNTVAALT